MNVHYLQHVRFEGLGSIQQWLTKEDASVSSTRFYESTVLPRPEEVDLLIVLGGPMSVNDDEKFPWLRIEKQFIRQAIDMAIPVLGICLGAQLIAATLGESVYPNRRKEIGWFPVEGVHNKKATTFTFPDQVDVFHWHGETFDLPQGAHLIARSEACENQAFQLGRSVIGLQFHLESTIESVQQIVANCREDIQPSKFVQPEAAILDQSPSKYLIINSLMEQILSYLTSQKK